MTTGDYAQFASGVIYLCPHCMGKRTDGSHDWHVLLNRSVSWSFSWVKDYRAGEARSIIFGWVTVVFFRVGETGITEQP